VSDPLKVTIPDIGTDEKVEVVEVLVAEGDRIARDDGLITLESEKASMDVPSPRAGVVREIRMKVGDTVGEGDLILDLEVESREASEKKAETSAASAAPSGAGMDVVGARRAPAQDEVTEHSGLDSGRQSAGRTPPQDLGNSNLQAEVVVLGAGVGGYTAAFRAADLGKKVVLVERYSVLGGVCLNVGCIPSKALLHIARVIAEARDAEEHGVYFGAPKIGLEQLRMWKDGVVERLTKGLKMMAGKRKVEVVQGVGRLTGAHSLLVEAGGGETRISFETAILAVGSRVVEIPGIPYEDPRVMDSTGTLELVDIPERLLLVGGGIVGLEMAMVYGALGSRITIVELLDGLIPGCDRDLVRPLERRLKKTLRAEIHLETKVTSIDLGDAALVAKLEGAKAPESAEFDRVLVAVGRRPNGDRLNAEAAGLKVDERGFVQVDRQMRTNVEHIFAIGDLVGEPMLAHKASHEGKVAAEVAAGHKSAFDARVIPSVAYTDPEIAWVGLTETEAEHRSVAYEKSSFPWSASGRAVGMGRTDGLTKILCEPGTGRILGGGIVGPGAGDLIAELVLAIEMDAEAGDLALTIHPHPTLSETLSFAGEIFEGTITDLYLPKKKR